jgi:hypothetical protein
LSSHDCACRHGAVREEAEKKQQVIDVSAGKQHDAEKRERDHRLKWRGLRLRLAQVFRIEWVAQDRHRTDQGDSMSRATNRRGWKVQTGEEEDLSGVFLLARFPTHFL